MTPEFVQARIDRVACALAEYEGNGEVELAEIARAQLASWQDLLRSLPRQREPEDE